jgi:replicative DNA helicase
MLETRTPPANIEAEQRLIVAALIDPALPGAERVVDEVDGIISADDFHGTQNRQLWSTITEMHRKQGTIDPAQLALRLKVSVR